MSDKSEKLLTDEQIERLKSLADGNLLKEIPRDDSEDDVISQKKPLPKTVFDPEKEERKRIFDARMKLVQEFLNEETSPERKQGIIRTLIADFLSERISNNNTSEDEKNLSKEHLKNLDSIKNEVAIAKLFLCTVGKIGKENFSYTNDRETDSSLYKSQVEKIFNKSVDYHQYKNFDLGFNKKNEFGIALFDSYGDSTLILMENGEKYRLPKATIGHMHVLENQMPLYTFVFGHDASERGWGARGVFDGKHFVIIGDTCGTETIGLVTEGNQYRSKFYHCDGEQFIALKNILYDINEDTEIPPSNFSVNEVGEKVFEPNESLA